MGELSMFVLLAAFAALSPSPLFLNAPPPTFTTLPPAPPPPPGPAQALNPPVGLFTQDDYPVEALRRDEEGLVIAQVDVTADGRVGGCTVVQSSGSQALDSGTCSILTRRARYRPARNQAGQAVADHERVRIKWLLPRDPYQATIESMEVRYRADGKLDGCTNRTEDKDQPPCRMIAQLVDAVRSKSGSTTELRGRTLTFEHRVDIDGLAWSPQRSDGLIVVWQQVAEYLLDGDGKLTECLMITGEAVMLGFNLCAQPLDGPYEIDRSGSNRTLRSSLSLLATP